MRSRSFQLVLSTCPDLPAAERIAEAVVGERLAACVNILPIAKSIYIWKGQVESAAELLLIMKTRRRDYRALERRLRALHPYELPEVIAIPIEAGLTDYLAWIQNPDKT